MDINLEFKEIGRLENTAELSKYISQKDQENLKYFFLGAAFAKTARTDISETEQEEGTDENTIEAVTNS